MISSIVPTIFVTSFSWSEPLSDEFRLRIETELPKSFLKDNTCYHRWQDRQNRLLSRWLIIRQLKKLNSLPTSGLANWEITTWGKPFLQNALPFSLSHTNGLAAVALSTLEVGIDVEGMMTEEHYENFSSVFSSEEMNFIQKSSRKNSAITTLWTRKEAILKAGGWGLRDDMVSLNTLKNPTTFENRSWFWQALNLPKPYLGHVASYTLFELQHEHLTQETCSRA